MVQWWKQWCRLCAREDDADYIDNALTDKDISQLHEVILKCFSINISKYDRLPQNICSKCRQFISTIICFSQKAVKAQEMFSEFLISLDDIDHRQLKARYGLQESDENDDFKVLTNSAYSELSEDIDGGDRNTRVKIESMDGDSNMNTCVKIENIDPDNASVCDISTHVKVEPVDEDEKKDVYDVNTRIKVEPADEDENTDMYDANTPVRVEPADEDVHTDVYDVNTRIKIEPVDEDENTDVCDTNSPINIGEDDNVNVRDMNTRIKIMRSDDDMFVTKQRQNNELEGQPSPKSSSHLPSNSGKNQTNKPKKIIPAQGTICTDCNKIFLTYLELRCHMQLEHGKLLDRRRFPCTKCGKNFMTPGRLQYHARSHLPPEQRRMVPCPYCDKPFTRKCTLRGHLKSIHKCVRPYIYEECGTSFATFDALREHRLIHYNKKLHECRECKKRFKLKSHLKYHEQTHKEKIHICTVCSVQFSKRQALTAHMVVHTGQKTYKCPFCGNEYKRIKYFEDHLNLHRKDQLAAAQASGLEDLETPDFPRLEQLKVETVDEDLISQPIGSESGCSDIVEDVPSN